MYIMNIYSCTGIKNSLAKITNVAELSNEQIRDTFIAICNINVYDKKVVGNVYACNLNETSLLDDSKHKKIPMVRVIVCKHADTSRWNLAEISGWFVPDNTSIEKIKKKLN